MSTMKISKRFTGRKAKQPERTFCRHAFLLSWATRTQVPCCSLLIPAALKRLVALRLSNEEIRSWNPAWQQLGVETNSVCGCTAGRPGGSVGGGPEGNLEAYPDT